MSRGDRDFDAFRAAAQDDERQRIAAHGPDCYGVYGACLSCGCNARDGIACVSHRGSPAYMADVQMRIAIALERIVERLSR